MADDVLNWDASPSDCSRQFPRNGVAHIRKSTKTTLVIVLGKKLHFKLKSVFIFNLFNNEEKHVWKSSILKFWRIEIGNRNIWGINYWLSLKQIWINILVFVQLLSGLCLCLYLFTVKLALRTNPDFFKKLPKQLEDQKILTDFRILRYFWSELQIRLRQTEMELKLFIGME